MEVGQRHAGWVRATHWVSAVAILVLAVSGIVILMAHPRLYWGEVGNDLTTPLFELPISRNHRHGGWTAPTPLTDQSGGPVSSSRTYDIFNRNGWGRSLHFLAAWALVLTGVVYAGSGLITGHFRRHLVPAPGELAGSRIARELSDHARLRIRPPTGGPQYGLFQKCAYTLVVFVGVPLAVLTGLAMSPAVTAAFPVLLSLLGGVQSARTIHFLLWCALVAFVAIHVLMVVLSGFWRQLRAMTIGD
jgi:thiosulfate reductase cytochrome b subunit